MVAEALQAFASGVASGSIRTIDLTQTLSPNTPTLVLPPEFGQCAGFSQQEISRYDERGVAWYWNNFTVGELTDSAVTNWLRIALLRLGGKGEISRGSLALAARVLAVTTLVGLVVSAAASGIVAPERWAEFALAVCT